MADTETEGVKVHVLRQNIHVDKEKPVQMLKTERSQG